MGWSNYLLVLVSVIVMFGLTGFTVRSSISTGHNLREKRRGSITRPRGLGKEVAGPSTSEAASKSSDERAITESPSTAVSESNDETADDEAISTRQVHNARENELKQWRAAEILKVSATDPSLDTISKRCLSCRSPLTTCKSSPLPSHSMSGGRTVLSLLSKLQVRCSRTRSLCPCLNVCLFRVSRRIDDRSDGPFV